MRVRIYRKMKNVIRVASQLCPLFMCVILLACGKKIVAEKEECGEMTFSQSVVLQVDTLLYSQIADIVPIGSSSYVLTDGASIYETDSTGTVIRKVSNQGHGNKEYIQIGKLYSDGQYIYAWCAMSLNLYKYDMDLNFIDKYQGPNCAVCRMAVLNGDTVYFQLTGGSDQAVCAAPLNHNGKMRREGCYTVEDKALLFNSISGGLACFDGRTMYVRPSEMTVCTVGSGEAWTYEDKDFVVNPVTKSLDARPPKEALDYLLPNSTCSGLYADGDFLWLITETGSFGMGQDGQMSSDGRFLNLYKINKEGNLVSSYKYNYPKGIRYAISGGRLHVLVYDGSTYVVKQLEL